MKLRLESATDTFVIEPEEAKNKPLIIGRLPESDLRILADDISREHAQLVCRGAGWYVKDLESKFGTSINGVPIKSGTPRRLNKGDLLAFGSYTFTVELIAPPRRAIGNRNAEPELETDEEVKADKDKTKVHEAIVGLDSSAIPSTVPKAGENFDGGPSKLGRKGHFAEIDEKRHQEPEAQRILRERRERNAKLGKEPENLPQMLEPEPAETEEASLEAPPVHEDLLNVAFQVDYKPPKNPEKNASHSQRMKPAASEQVQAQDAELESTNEEVEEAVEVDESAVEVETAETAGVSDTDEAEQTQEEQAAEEPASRKNRPASTRSARTDTKLTPSTRRGRARGDSDGSTSSNARDVNNRLERGTRAKRERPQPQKGGMSKLLGILLLVFILVGATCWYMGLLDPILGQKPATSQTQEAVRSPSNDTQLQNQENPGTTLPEDLNAQPDTPASTPVDSSKKEPLPSNVIDDDLPVGASAELERLPARPRVEQDSVLDELPEE